MADKYKNLSHNEIVMGFVASCVENVADRLGVPYIEIFERMDRVGLIDGFIFEHYETLHTESRENLTELLIDALNRWEENSKP